MVNFQRIGFNLSLGKEIGNEKISDGDDTGNDLFNLGGINRDSEIPYRIHLDNYVEIKVPIVGNFVGIYRGVDSNEVYSAVLYPYVTSRAVRGSTKRILSWEYELGPEFVPLQGSVFERVEKQEIDIRISNDNSDLTYSNDG